MRFGTAAALLLFLPLLSETLNFLSERFLFVPETPRKREREREIARCDCGEKRRRPMRQRKRWPEVVLFDGCAIANELAAEFNESEAQERSSSGA